VRPRRYTPSTLRPRAFAFLAFAALGCHSGVPRQPPGIAPTLTTVTREEPGGDASDPHEAALERLLKEPWGWRNDKQDALHVPLPDWKNWRRIRYFGVPTFVGFRYGDDHHAVIAVWVREADEGTTPDQCLDNFEKWGESTARSFSVKVGAPVVSRAPWKPLPGEGPDGAQEVVIRSVDAEIATLFARSRYAAAYAAYTMWPKTCTIFGVAVPVRDSEELAHQVRDRYVSDGFWRLERRMDITPAL
jgi:hypothetical protein